MRFVLILIVSLVTLLGGAGAGLAGGNAPWCANMNVGFGTMVADCHYWTVEECVPNVIAGNKGFCGQNPRWQGTYDPVTGQPVGVVKKHPKRRAYGRH